ncbi:IS1182 family transposase [Bradyrhizobium sp. CSA207]|uniref:IS1182 family transposase n=1 Tax=Bradyrhizobium sp. CSA207 TaxID=2698826 RepID=UPI0023AE6E3C|nr:IS1182 family transposase [Bradyrhizobium sp. CSA207]MDE5447338.1 IS1182 family transposase [Bradyrhizobium sp. CSA207]
MANRTFKTGISRDQPSFLPPRVDDYVAIDNPVRAIEAFVAALDLGKLGFSHAGSGGGAGQPPYDPADLLKLYLYGYINRVRSSRSLEREAGRNLELIWLMKRLVPGYRTIAKFRQENWKALKAVHREFVLVLRHLDLVGGEIVAIDGAFFDGNASKASIKTQRKLAKRLAEIEQEIEAYGAALEANDSAEADRPAVGRDGEGDGGGNVAQKMTALMARRASLQADLAQLEESGQTQLSRTDPDARLLSKNGQVVAGYNVQIAVDGKHKLLVEDEVVNDGNDTGQLHNMAKAAKAELGVETLTVLADTGYYNGNALKACEEDGIVAYVPQARRNARLEAEGRISHEAFVYDAEANVYRCPAGKLLTPTDGRKNNGGRIEIRYVSRKADCDACTLRSRCLSAKTPTRTVQRWEHEDVLDRHRARMKGANALMSRRAQLAEHPFGTLKCRAGYRHFLVRGFDKVRGEWSLMALCYNFSRVLSILGFDSFMAYLAKSRPYPALLLLNIASAIIAGLQTLMFRPKAGFCLEFGSPA